MHLTLKFLGSIDEKTENLASEALKRAAGTYSPFTITTKKIELKGRRLLWVGFKENRALAELKELIEAELESIGITRDKRPFSPHLTLMRIRRKKGFLEVKERLANIESTQEICFLAPSIELMKSELTKKGAIHSTVMKIIFQRAPKTIIAVDDI